MMDGMKLKALLTPRETPETIKGLTGTSWHWNPSNLPFPQSQRKFLLEAKMDSGRRGRVAISTRTRVTFWCTGQRGRAHRGICWHRPDRCRPALRRRGCRCCRQTPPVASRSPATTRRRESTARHWTFHFRFANTNVYTTTYYAKLLLLLLLGFGESDGARSLSHAGIGAVLRVAASQDAEGLLELFLVGDGVVPVCVDSLFRHCVQKKRERARTTHTQHKASGARAAQQRMTVPGGNLTETTWRK